MKFIKQAKKSKQLLGDAMSLENFDSIVGDLGRIQDFLHEFLQPISEDSY